MMQIAKAAALIAEFDLCLKGCVKDAAAAYDRHCQVVGAFIFG